MTLSAVDKRREIVRHLVNDGVSVQWAANLLGVSPAIVQGDLAAIRAATAPRPVRGNQTLRETVLAAYAAPGATTHTVGVELGVTKDTVARIAREAGTIRRPGQRQGPNPGPTVDTLPARVIAAYTHPGATARTVALALGSTPATVARIARDAKVGRYAPAPTPQDDQRRSTARATQDRVLTILTSGPSTPEYVVAVSGLAFSAVKWALAALRRAGYVTRNYNPGASLYVGGLVYDLTDAGRRVAAAIPTPDRSTQ